MSKPNKIANHQDREEIVRWLTEGVSVREVEKRLRIRYPKKNQAQLRVCSSAIQDFKSNHLNIKGKVLADIKEASLLSRTWAKQQEEHSKVEKLSAYKDAISRIVQHELDVTSEILKVYTIIEGRIESLYNRLVDREFPDREVEKLLQNYLDQFMRVLDQHKKYVEGYKEQVDVNVNVNVMTEQIGVMREALREVLSEVDPNLIPLFMGKLNLKMRELVYKNTDTQFSEKKTAHTALLDNVLSGADVD